MAIVVNNKHYIPNFLINFKYQTSPSPPCLDVKRFSVCSVYEEEFVNQWRCEYHFK